MPTKLELFNAVNELAEMLDIKQLTIEKTLEMEEGFFQTRYSYYADEKPINKSSYDILMKNYLLEK